MGFQIEAKKVFCIGSMCTNQQCSHLGMDNLEMLIIIYTNWPSDACVNIFPWKFMEMEETLMDENEDVIASFKFLDMDENNYGV